MDNLRRRLEKEKADAIKFALENFFHELLPVLDSFDRAIPDQNGGEAQDADAGFKSGINMVKKQLFQVLSKHGLEAVQSIGQPFDPNVHQAIQKIESDTAKQEMVGSEFARGYLLRGRLVRPAMVSVLSPKA
jgi:molecular chaperone GrpE